MSLFNTLMDFAYDVTIQMLANATNAPGPLIVNLTSMTLGSTNITVSSTDGMFETLKIYGTGIPTNTRITEVSNDGITLTLSHAATVTAASGLITVGQAENIAPIDYVENVGVLKNPHSDYAFYLVSFEDENINKQMDVSITEAEGSYNRTTTYVRNLRFDWQIYGDNAMEWADTLRIMLYDPTIKALFAAQGITLIPEIKQAYFIPENINQQWFNRYDISAKFNQLCTLQSPTQIIDSINIIIEDNEGVTTCLS